MWHPLYLLFQMHYLYECCSNYVIIWKLMHSNKPKDHQRNANGRECFLFKLWIHISFSFFLEGYKNRKFANLIEESSNVKSLSTEKKMKSIFLSLFLSHLLWNMNNFRKWTHFFHRFLLAWTVMWSITRVTTWLWGKGQGSKDQVGFSLILPQRVKGLRRV